MGAPQTVGLHTLAAEDGHRIEVDACTGARFTLRLYAPDAATPARRHVHVKWDRFGPMVLRMVEADPTGPWTPVLCRLLERLVEAGMPYELPAIPDSDDPATAVAETMTGP